MTVASSRLRALLALVVSGVLGGCSVPPDALLKASVLDTAVVEGREVLLVRNYVPLGPEDYSVSLVVDGEPVTILDGVWIVRQYGLRAYGTDLHYFLVVGESMRDSGRLCYGVTSLAEFDSAKAHCDDRFDPVTFATSGPASLRRGTLVLSSLLPHGDDYAGLEIVELDLATSEIRSTHIRGVLLSYVDDGLLYRSMRDGTFGDMVIQSDSSYRLVLEVDEEEDGINYVDSYLPGWVFVQTEVRGGGRQELHLVDTVRDVSYGPFELSGLIDEARSALCHGMPIMFVTSVDTSGGPSVGYGIGLVGQELRAVVIEQAGRIVPLERDGECHYYLDDYLNGFEGPFPVPLPSTP